MIYCVQTGIKIKIMEVMKVLSWVLLGVSK